MCIVHASGASTRRAEGGEQEAEADHGEAQDPYTQDTGTVHLEGSITRKHRRRMKTEDKAKVIAAVWG